MTAYYNEIEPYAADRLRQLIKEGLIAPGEVDTRSIVDVRPSDLAGYAQCHFFAGLGGWPGALRLAGFPDDRPVWTGSCPCQPFSLAGKQKGFADERHLWPVWRELIAERRPAKVYGEQVASAAQWLRLVRGDLEAMDYAVGAIPIEAASAGADHLRDRFWFAANSPSEGSFPSAQSEIHCGEESPGPRYVEPERLRGGGDMGNARGEGLSVGSIAEVERGDVRQERPTASAPGDRGCGILPNSACEQMGSSGQPRQHSGMEWVIGADGKARRVKSGVRLLVDGIPGRVAKLRALGNAIDLRPAAAFIKATM